MKRGFLNTPRYKRAIEDGDRHGHDAEKKAKPSTIGATREVAMDVDDEHTTTTTVVDTDMSGAGATTQSAESEGTSLARDGAVHSTAVASSPKDADPNEKGKGKEKAVDVDAGASDRDNDTNRSLVSRTEWVLMQRLLPWRPGLGRRPDEEFFHTVPRGLCEPLRKRAMFRVWPRRPDGGIIYPGEDFKGTLSPDGYPWAATLYDFYAVNRIPKVWNAVTYMTGSALVEEMKALDELDFAASEIEWALTEGKPRDEGVADTETLITLMEITTLSTKSLHSRVPDKADGHQEEEKEKHAAEGDDGNKGVWAIENDKGGEAKDKHDDSETSILPPPTIPVTSPFHPSHYPKPWPLVPFENPFSVLLQERIPYYLLPRKLYVHDPFSILPARREHLPNKTWNSQPDIVRTYDLRLAESVCEEAQKAREKAEAEEQFKARTLIVLRYKRTKEQIKNYEPVIEVPLPPYPPRKTTTEESHLYLSPVARVGEGNHSIVYKGEWELPRDLFATRKICEACFKESTDKEIQRLKDTGRWEKLLEAAAWGPKGPTGRQPTMAGLAAASDPTRLKRDEETIEREIICVSPPDVSPLQVWETVDESIIWDKFMERREKTAAIVDFAELSGKGKEDPEQEQDSVPIIRVDPPFSQDGEKTCTHRESKVPRTAMFTVVAKLSLEHDPHLEREAGVYQEFPEHFFRHYDGYTIIGQLRTIVPVHAIVPQFYGYYVPQGDTGEVDLGGGKRSSYLSPILLLEHCGKPVDPERLSPEDQEECASLVLRFQRAKWLHGSLAPRNFLVQKGKPTEFPSRRKAHPELSFRLIDFGRSRRYESTAMKQIEERNTMDMFRELQYKMAMTLPG